LNRYLLILKRLIFDEIFTEDCVCYEPRGVHRGRDEIES